MARSARGPKSRFQGRLQPFSPLLISFSGRHELKILSHAELSAKPLELLGSSMMCGFYLNELLVRLLQKGESNQELFELYLNTLEQLQQSGQVECVLRLFEKRLLAMSHGH